MTRGARLWRDARGVTATEFALVAPVLLLMMMGTGEIAFEGYTQAVLNGAMQKAARDGTIQGNSSDTATASLDQTVKSIVSRVIPTATYASTRTNYDNYGAIAGEPFTDSRFPNNSSGVYDGLCNHGETYVDVNANGRYDLDLSSGGQGSANDVTNYTMKVTFQRIFPAKIIGLPTTVTLTASTILKNQPYATQSVNSGTKTGTCS